MKIRSIVMVLSILTNSGRSEEPEFLAKQKEIIFKCPIFEGVNDRQKGIALLGLQHGFTPEGGYYLVDSKKGGFWYATEMGEWSQLIEGLSARKEFGGMTPMLDIRFVGKHRFLVSYTSSKNDDKDIKAKTILISVNGVIAETADYLAASGPFIKVPESWYEKFEISIEYRGLLD
jgi:hypothetical protein